MLVPSYYSKKFHSDDISINKYTEIYNKAILIRNLKNEMSLMISKNINKYIHYKRIDMQNEIYPLISGRIESSFTHAISAEVYRVHQKKFNNIISKISFDVFKIVTITHTRNTKKHRIGEIEIKNTPVRSNVSTTLTYLAKYGRSDTIEYIKNLIPSSKKEMKEFYSIILKTCDSFGLDRLMRLASNKRNRIIKEYENPVEFVSLTLGGRSRIKKDIATLNKNKKSKIKAFIEISWSKEKTLKIPVKYSDKYHGDLKKYTNGTDTSYLIELDEIEKNVTVILTKIENRYYPEINLCEEDVVGFDVNTKNNMIIGSNGFIAKNNIKSLNKLIEIYLKIDNMARYNEQYICSKRKKIKIKALKRSIDGHRIEMVSMACIDMANKRQSHAILEDIHSFKKSRVKTKQGMSQNKITDILRICQIKHDFDHIGRKYGIAVSFVQAAYTSQECSVCHFIHPGNRVTQETFKCLDCGHEENADSNASYTIGSRVSEAVLRNLLDASQTVNGAFRPKSYTIKQVKYILDACRDSRQKRDRISTNLGNKTKVDSQ